MILLWDLMSLIISVSEMKSESWIAGLPRLVIDNILSKLITINTWEFYEELFNNLNIWHGDVARFTGKYEFVINDRSILQSTVAKHTNVMFKSSKEWEERSYFEPKRENREPEYSSCNYRSNKVLICEDCLSEHTKYVSDLNVNNGICHRNCNGKHKPLDIGNCCKMAISLASSKRINKLCESATRLDNETFTNSIILFETDLKYILVEGPEQVKEPGLKVTLTKLLVQEFGTYLGVMELQEQKIVFLQGQLLK